MKLFTSLLLSCACVSLTAQTVEPSANRKCGTVTYKPSQHAGFEEWMQSTLIKSDQFANARKASEVYMIPIVFHVLHSGTNVGVSRNISQAQVNSQVAILNNDYRKTNADFSTYVTQSALVAASADMEINFCAVRVDPTGNVLAEPGIDRIKVSDKGWNALPYDMSYIESTVKPNSIWDPNKYYNVWILEFGGSDVGTLGYAQFPDVPTGTAPITDMVGEGGPANTDGVVIDYRNIGNTGAATAPYNKGRTLTHETGHWLGLWHIWGDDSDCSGTDYVADTPNQKVESSTCPTPAGAVKTDVCSATAPGINYQNYMDYTDDKCMVMFTAGQKARMQAVMANCTRRTSVNGAVSCIDVGVKEVQNAINVTIFPNPAQGEITVSLELMNSQDVTISVVNTLGQTVKEVKQIQSNGGNIKVDVSDKTEGVYFVTVKCKSGSFTKRIILQ